MSSRSFGDRRDTAIVRLFVDTGMRLSEMAGLALTDIDLDADVALVLGKGRRPRVCPFGDKTGQAIERYLRERSKHRLARSAQLWIGGRGHMTDNGIGQMLRRALRRPGSIIFTRTCSVTPSRTVGWLMEDKNKISCGLLVGEAERCSLATELARPINVLVKHTAGGG